MGDRNDVLNCSLTLTSLLLGFGREKPDIVVAVAAVFNRWSRGSNLIKLIVTNPGLIYRHSPGQTWGFML